MIVAGVNRVGGLRAGTADAALVQQSLERVLASSRFATASRLARFLRFVVEKKLAGEEADIKEYTIAIEVYDRRSDYDPRVDSIVRVEASRLRTRLREYYAAEGSGEALRFEIPRGSYVPDIVPVAAETPPENSAAPSVAEVPASPEAPEQARSWPGVSGLILGIAGFAVVAAVLLTLRPAPPKSAPEGRALELYLQAKDHLRFGPAMGQNSASVPPNVLKAINLFEEALRVDDGFALAWSGLGATCAYAMYYDRHLADELQQKAETASRRALQLDESLAESHATLSDVAQFRRWDFRTAETEARRAVDLNPADVHYQQALSDLLRMLGRHEDASAALSRAEALKPAEPLLLFQRAMLLFDRRDWVGAEQKAKEALAIRSDHRPSRWLLGRSLEEQGRLHEAEQVYRDGLVTAPTDSRFIASLGYLYGRTKRAGAAREMIRTLDDLAGKGRPVQVPVALVRTGLGEHAAAVAALEQAVAARESAIPYLRLEPRFAPLRNTETYRRVAQRTGLQ